MKRPRILVDCDGILSDFNNATLDLIFRNTGRRHTIDEIVRWDIFESLGIKDKEHLLDEAVKAGGFCSGLQVLPGSKQAIEELRRLGDVYVVTSPYDAPNWVYERTQWLKEHFGFAKKQVGNLSAKFLVRGDVFIDDSDRNVVEWAEEHPTGLSILWDAPWNRHADPPGVHRMTSWGNLLSAVKEHLKSK